MSVKTATTQTQTAPTRKAGSRMPSSGGKGQPGITRETVADDIAAFKKAGGRIEVLGHTPLRSMAAARAGAQAASAAPAAAATNKTIG